MKPFRTAIRQLDQSLIMLREWICVMHLMHGSRKQSWRRFVCGILLIWGSISQASSVAVAQETRLLEMEPYDVIVLNKQNQGKVLKTFPIEFPDGKKPASPKPSDSLRIRLLEDPSEELELKWSGVERLIRFEDRLLAQARKLTSQKKFDEAFEYLAFVRDNYPDAERLNATVDTLLVTEAASFYRNKQFERASLLLDEAYRRAPGRRGLKTAIERVLKARGEQLLSSSQYSSTRRLYDLSGQKYARVMPELFAQWRQQLSAAAQQRLTEAQQDMQAGRMRQAYLASRDVLEIWPTLEGGKEFAARAAQQYPLVRAAVMFGAGEERPNSQFKVDEKFTWVGRRHRRLLGRDLFELAGAGADGAKYRCTPGEATVAPDYRSIRLTIATDASSISAMHVAQLMLAPAQRVSPITDPTWQARLERVGTDDARTAWAQVRSPVLRPEALLNVPLSLLPTTSLQAEWRPYDFAAAESSQSRYTVNSQYAFGTATQPREVIEQTMPSPRTAVIALRNGEVDLIDRVFPAEVSSLRRESDRIRLVRYRVPTLHALVPNFNRPHPGNRIFRRAVLYAIDREKILARDLLAGNGIEGCRVISGPFSPGLFSNDPMAYGHDTAIEPRAYAPRHAKTLIQLAQVELIAAASKRQTDPPQLTELVIAFPACEIARVACDEIVADLKLIGLPCRLRGLPAGQARPTDDEWDFLYLDYQAADPLVDAPRLLAADGFARCPSPHLNLSLRQLSDVLGWNEAGKKLRRCASALLRRHVAASTLANR